MRSSNSIKNAIIAVIMNIVIILLGFITQKIFVITLGSEYLGINGLFNNILSILAVIELGFGNAIIFHLYKPMADGNEKEITVLVKFYKKVYRVIATVIFVIGIVIMPFIKYIVGDVSINESVSFLFFLALMDIVVSYMLTYKRSVLYADQKNYIVNIVHIGYTVLLDISKIIFLLVTRNYLVYLFIRIVFRLLENIVISKIVDKKYPYVNNKIYNEELDGEIKKDINQKVRGLIFHKIGTAFVTGTDNIIISKIIGVVTVGMYSGYNMIISAISNIIYQVFDSIISVIGNLLIENDKEKSYDIYQKMQLMNSWICCWAGTCILCLIQPFIVLWLDKDYLLSFPVVVILVINFYIYGMRRPNHTFKEAAGIFYEDRFVPILEVIINIVASILLGKYLGLIGIFIGTTISSIVVFLYSYPILVYKKLFGKSYFKFWKEFLGYFILSLACMLITYKITTLLAIENLMITLIVNLVICMIVPNLIYFVLFGRSENFKYYIEIFKKFLKKDKKVSEKA